MTREPVIDERAVAVAGVGYRLAYFLLSTAVMFDGAVRVLFLHDAAWDLLGLVLASSLVATLYLRAKHVRVISRRRMLVIMVACTVVSAAFGVVLALCHFGN